MSAYYLLDHPPARDQYLLPRRGLERGVVVVHTAENTPDYVAFDGGAEAVARFIAERTTPGSYHELVDSDSSVPMVPDHAEAFGDGTGSNAWAWHLSIATRADVWPWAPPEWSEGAVEQAARAAARYAGRLRSRTGIVIPARRITRAESESGVPGFISHGDRDPDRRHDPGAEFPWAAFLARFAELTTDQPGDDMGAYEQAQLDSIGAKIDSLGTKIDFALANLFDADDRAQLDNVRADVTTAITEVRALAATIAAMRSC